jgi:hypothetical protein
MIQSVISGKQKQIQRHYRNASMICRKEIRMILKQLVGQFLGKPLSQQMLFASFYLCGFKFSSKKHKGSTTC